MRNILAFSALLILSGTAYAASVEEGIQQAVLEAFEETSLPVFEPPPESANLPDELKKTDDFLEKLREERVDFYNKERQRKREFRKEMREERWDLKRRQKEFKEYHQEARERQQNFFDDQQKKIDKNRTIIKI